MKYSLYDLLDRASIVRIKIEKISDTDKQMILKKEQEELIRAIEEYTGSGECNRDEANQWLGSLYALNSIIWDLEAKIGDGKNGNLSLEEVGKASIEIRGINSRRIAIRNEIVKRTGIGHVDIKMYHASESGNQIN